VDSAIAVLKALPSDGSTTGVSQLARHLGLHKSKVSRILATLEGHHFVQRDPESGRVSLGLGLIALVGPLLGRLDVAKAAKPVLDAIAAETGETAFIALWCDQQALMVEQTIGTRAVVHHSWPGKMVPAHTTAAGKVFLAFLPPDAVARVLQPELPACTPFTITGRPELLAELRRTVECGYAVNDQENELESCGVAAPVRRHGGDVVAALTLAVPKHRFDARLDLLARAVVRAAERVSRRLGWGGRQDP
jgi:DNA-binding IclR family transcriptional regulator